MALSGNTQRLDAVEEKLEVFGKQQAEISQQLAEVRELLEAQRTVGENSEARAGARPRYQGEGNDTEARGLSRYRRLEMPVFGGEDPDGWIVRCEQYFEFHGMSEFEKLQATIVAMEGGALRWHWWENRRRPFVSWEDVKERLLGQFRPVDEGDLHGQWFAVAHTTTVAQYRREFIDKAAPLEDVSEAVMRSRFIHGLKEEVRVEVRMLETPTLEGAMDLAMKVEEKLRIRSKLASSNKSSHFSYFSKSPINPSLKGPAQYPTHSTNSNQPNPTKSHPNTINSTYPANTFNHTTAQASSRPSSRPNSTTPSTHFSGNVRRLSEREFQDRKAKGLCFKCDERWSIGHKCREKGLSVLIVEEEEDAKGEMATMEAPEDEFVETAVSINSLVGFTNPKTMKIRGMVGGHSVIVMIDPGATHNFISLTCVSATGLEVDEGGAFGVSLGNGDTVKGKGVCRKVNLELGDRMAIEEDFLPLQLGNSDMILGVQWLETLG